MRKKIGPEGEKNEKINTEQIHALVGKQFPFFLK